MRILRSLLLLTILSIFAFAQGEKENTQILKNLYEKVILKDVDKSLNDLKDLENTINEKNSQKSKNSFKKLVKSWKSVETFYILGDLNEDYIDTPRYIDIFHNGNEDITKQLDRAIKSKDEVRIALFKNSTKSINALEYILFTKDIKEKRVNEIALTIVKKLSSHINDIKDEYLVQKNEYLKDLTKINAIVINTIIQSTYKLKEWRVGDIIGLTKKYEGKPDNRRAEYFLSKTSATAIEAILETYKELLDNNSFEDYGDFLMKLTDGKEMKKLRESLSKSLILVKQIKNDDFSNAKELYEEIDTIHIVLFVEMIEELSINAKILDSDGD